jgi:hypothetical protein
MEKREHEIHQRRKGRNILVGLVLGGFVLVVFAVTVVKMTEGAGMDMIDHRLDSGTGAAT